MASGLTFTNENGTKLRLAFRQADLCAFVTSADGEETPIPARLIDDYDDPRYAVVLEWLCELLRTVRKDDR